MSTYASFQAASSSASATPTAFPIEVRSPGNVAEPKLSSRPTSWSTTRARLASARLDHRMVKQKSATRTPPSSPPSVNLALALYGNHVTGSQAR